LRLWKQKWTGQHFLSELGIECYNGGSWLDVNIIYHKQQNKMINTLKKIFGLGPKVDYADLVKQGAVILDVRSQENTNKDI
jgi:hypothetical protein